MSRMIYLLFYLFKKFLEKASKEHIKSKFAQIGKNVSIGSNCIFTPSSIELGNYVFIGSNAVFQSTHGRIRIGSHVMFGPNVHIHGGNHVINKVGSYMDCVDLKKMGEDGEIVIEDDVWIGANAIILKGVKIGEGSVVGAGSVVTKNVDPYSVVAGNPCKPIGERFSASILQEHKKIIRKKLEK